MKKPGGTTKPSKKRADPREVLAVLEQHSRSSARSAAELRKELKDGHPKKGRKIPDEGSRWTEHPAFLQEHQERHVWTFLMWAWGGHAGNDYTAVLEREVEGKPCRKLVELDRLFVEWVPAKGKRGAKS